MGFFSFAIMLDIAFMVYLLASQSVTSTSISIIPPNETQLYMKLALFALVPLVVLSRVENGLRQAKRRW